MIDDPEIEERLQRFRPSAAPVELRSRALAISPGRHVVASCSWLLPLTAAAAAIVLYALAGQARRAAMSASVDPSIDAEIETISDQLGGGPLARYFARAAAARPERRDQETPIE